MCTIRALYPIIGGYALLSSVGLLIFYFKDFRKSRTNSRTPDKEESSDRDQAEMSAKMKVVLVSIMAAMFFIYVGMEVAFGTFISIFAVKSSLRFTRPEGWSLSSLISRIYFSSGSTVAAVFWGTFAATRGLAILLAMVANMIVTKSVILTYI